MKRVLSGIAILLFSVGGVTSQCVGQEQAIEDGVQ